MIDKQYNDCLNKIYHWAVFRSKAPPVDRRTLNLDQMRLLAGFFGNPQKEFKIIHVAGTNGKGSVSLKVATCLEKVFGLRVGLFTSPHIASFRERFVVNGQLPSKRDVVEACHRVFEMVEKEASLDVRFFEVVTMVGLLLFQRAKVDYVVLECGLGGALDATNIVTADEVVCSCITSIGYDHMDVLGDTLEEIASEKAGVIKKGVPCVVGPTAFARNAI